MFQSLNAPEDDPILALSGIYKKDPRAQKIDLGVGVFKDLQGNTPIMQAVRTAEAQLVKTNKTKSYVGMRGNLDFNARMIDLIVPAAQKHRASAVQAVGGSGALALVARLIKLAKPDATVWISDPTWSNHYAIMQHAGLKCATYPYFDKQSASLRFDALTATLAKLGPNDVVLFHSCCHNPTGVNPDQAQWDQLAQLCQERGFMPLFDLAYHGFGHSLEQDGYSIARFAALNVPMLVAASCSKNFGLYRDRVGVAIALGSDAAQADIMVGHMATYARMLYSMPPDPGAAIVNEILGSTELRQVWKDELDAMRTQMIQSRASLTELLRRYTNSNRFDFIQQHSGMFSMLGISAAACDWLREERALFMVRSSRMNIAGVTPTNVDAIAQSIAQIPADILG